LRIKILQRPQAGRWEVLSMKKVNIAFDDDIKAQLDSLYAGAYEN